MIIKPTLSILNLIKITPILSTNQTLYLISRTKQLLSCNSTQSKAKHSSTSSLKNINTYQSIKNNFTTSTFSESYIQSLQQYIRGSQLLQKGQYALAIAEFQIALKFLPKSMDGDNKQQYSIEYGTLLKKLLQAHVMMNRSVKQFKQLNKLYLTPSSPFGQFVDTLAHIQQQNFQPLQANQNPQKLWKQLIRAFAFKHSKQCFGKHIPIEKIKQTTDHALKYVGLYLYEKIKARKNKERQDIYLNTCRQLLKQTEQFQPSKIVKPLTLMASNFLSGDQFLQAEGLMSHCLSVLQQYYHQSPTYLKNDQQYILCKLMIARVFEGVRRNQQSKKIREEYEPLFDEKKFLIQQLVQISHREL